MTLTRRILAGAAGAAVLLPLAAGSAAADAPTVTRTSTTTASGVFAGGDVSLSEHVYLQYSSFAEVGGNICYRSVAVYGPQVDAAADPNITLTATSASLSPTEVPVLVSEFCTDQLENFVSADEKVLTGTLSIEFTATGDPQRVPHRYGTTPGVSVHGGVATRTPAQGRVVLDAGDVQLDTVIEEASIADIKQVLVQL